MGITREDTDRLRIPCKTISLYILKGLEGILGSKRIRLTRSDFLNDRQEVTFFGDFLHRQLDCYETTQSISSDFLNVFRNEFRWEAFSLEIGRRFFILSMTPNEDSLPMWNYYGKNDGYCIGLHSKRFIDSMFDKYKAHHGYVIYDPDTIQGIIDQEINIAYNYWLENKADPGMLYQIARTIAEKWYVYSLFTKHKGFVAEEEYRIVVDFNINKLRENYISRRGIMTPYIEVDPTDQNGVFPLDNIRTGPLIPHEQATVGLNGWLLAEGYGNIDVYPSDIPLRF